MTQTKQCEAFSVVTDMLTIKRWQWWYAEEQYSNRQNNNDMNRIHYSIRHDNGGVRRYSVVRDR